MAASKAKFRIVGRDLIAAALIGPGPGLDAAMSELAWFDGEKGQSRISTADLRRLAHDLVRATPPALRLELIELMAQQPSLTVRSVCAFGLAQTWGQGDHMDVADKLSRDGSIQVQLNLGQALLELEAEQQRLLSQMWFESPLSRQRALAGRMSVANPTPQALKMLTTLASDEEVQVREAVVEAMIDLAGSHLADVHQTLQAWAENPEKRTLWVLTRIISRAPFNRDIPSAIRLLEGFADQIPTDRDIRRWVISVLRALARQHSNQLIQEALSVWLNGDNPTLAEVAAEALRRIA